MRKDNEEFQMRVVMLQCCWWMNKCNLEDAMAGWKGGVVGRREMVSAELQPTFQPRHGEGDLAKKRA